MTRMRDDDCVAFLHWALPRLGYRWPGFRRVRRQVCKRIGRRIHRLGIESLRDYRLMLERKPEEWSVLDGFCRITISRFYRDRRIFALLGTEVLPQLTRIVGPEERILNIWSAGCGAGEEPYTVTVLHELSTDPEVRDVGIEVTATDVDESQLIRARAGVYPRSSLRDLPRTLRDQAFESEGAGVFRLRDRFRKDVLFHCQDLRHSMPARKFSLILCRNLAFTYFDEALQRQVLAGLLERLLADSYLVLGSHETIPRGDYPLESLQDCASIFRRI